MATDTDRAISLIREKVEVLTGERANGERRAVLIGELENLLKVVTAKTTSLDNKIDAEKKAITDEYWQNLLDEHHKISAEIDAAVAESSRQLKQAIAEAKIAINDVRQSSQAARLEAHSVFQDAQTSITRLREESNSAFSELAQITETILEIRSDVDGNSASITEEAGARASADLALSGQITTINAKVNDNTAAITSEAVARAASDSALSSRIDNVTAAAGGATAMVDAEATARINADNALAAQITSVSATASKQRVFNQSSAPSATGRIVGDLWYDSANGLKPYFWNGTAWVDNSDNRFTTIAASVTTETAARVSGDNALSAQITSLTSTVNGNVAAINNEAATRANADSALSSSLSALTSTVNTNKATLDQEITTRASADNALSSSISSLTSTVNTNKAALDQEITTRANADSAISASVTSLTSTVNANKASLDNEIVTRANQTSALSSQITSLTSTVNANKATLDQEAVTRANADTALSGQITSLTTTVNNNKASLDQEIIARTNGDTAISSSVNNLSTTVNGHTSSINTLSASYNGMAVKYGVTGYINGQTGGFVLTGVGRNDGSASYLMEITADVVINGNLLVNGTVQTAKIANRATTDVAFSAAGYANSGEASVFAPAGSLVSVFGTYAGNDRLVNGPETTFRLYVNGGQVAAGGVPKCQLGTLNVYAGTSLGYVFSVGSDTTIRASSFVDRNANWLGQCTVQILVLKR